MSSVPSYNRSVDQPLWTPSPERVANARLTAFLQHVSRACGHALAGYESLFRFSLDHPAEFWTAVWDFCGIVAQTRGDRIIDNAERMPGARSLPDARLNFAENLLRSDDDRPALIFRSERAGGRTL